MSEIFDIFDSAVLLLDEESRSKVKAVGMEVDKVNRNNRLYTREAVLNGIKRLQFPIAASDGHPGWGSDTFGRKVIRWDSAQLIDGKGGKPGVVYLEGELIDTQAANDLRSVIDSGLVVGLSTRGWINEAEEVEDKTAEDHYIKVTDMDFITWDVVDDPASDGTFMTLDAKGNCALLFDNIKKREEMVMDETKVDGTENKESSSQANDNSEMLKQILENQKQQQAKQESLEKRLQAQESNNETSQEELQAQFARAERQQFELDCSAEMVTFRRTLSRRLLDNRVSADLSDECEELILTAIKAVQFEGELTMDRFRADVEKITQRFIKQYSERSLKDSLDKMVNTNSDQRSAADYVDVGMVTDEQDEVPGMPGVTYGSMRKHINDVGPMSINVLRETPEYGHICNDIVNRFMGETKSLQRSSHNVVPLGLRDWTKRGMEVDPNMRIVGKILDGFDEENHHAMVDEWTAWLEYERAHYGKYTNAERKQYQSGWFLDAILTSGASGSNAIVPLTNLFSRALVMVTYPMMVTPSIFNFDTVDAQKTDIYIDARTSLRTGGLVTVQIPAPSGLDGLAANGSLKLAQRNLTSLKFGASSGGTFTEHATASERPAVVVDMYNGVIHNNGSAAIDLNSSITHLEVIYAPYANAENTEVAGTLDVKPDKKLIEITKDAVSVRISDEAETYTARQTSWNARARALFNLSYDMVEKTDAGMLGLALFASDLNKNTAAAADLSTGDTRSETLVRAIGDARAHIAGLDYPIDAIVSSPKVIQVLREWDGFKDEGFPDSTLRPNGVVASFQGVNVYETTQMPANTVLVCNGESVYHRSLRGKSNIVKGPYPVFGGTSMGVVGAQQWVAENWDWADVIRGANAVKIPVTF